MRYLSIALIAVLACVPPAYSQKAKKGPAALPVLDLKGKTKAEALDLLIPGMGEKELTVRYNQQQQWQEICLAAGAPGKEADRLEICKLMCAKLGADVPEQARVWLLRQLEYIGRGEAVAAVGKCLDDPSELIRETAIRSLANNPAEEASTPLVVKLPSADAKTKVSIANALAFRRAPTAVAALAAELKSEPTAVSQAAARALGRIASADAATQLAKARGSAKEPLRLWICDAYLLCADKLLKDSKTQEAGVIYNDLYDNEKIRSVRMAALRGVLRSSGDAAGDRIVKLLTADDRDARDIALVEITGISPKSLQALATSFEKLPPQAQILLLGALAARGDKSQAPIALSAAKSTNDALQRAGMIALGKLGDASAVQLLVETAFSKSKHAAAARESLTQITGADDKLITMLKAEKAPTVRSTLIVLLAERGAGAAAPIFLQDAVADDAGLRLAAIGALARLAEPKDVPALVPVVLKAAKGKERDEAEKAIVAIVGRIQEPEKRADPVVAALTPESRTALLPLLGRLGGPKALAAVKESLASDSKEQKSAAVTALTNWPDETVSADLLVLAKESPDGDVKKAAFAGLIRVNSISNERPAPPRLASLKQAMELASSDGDKKLVIDALATVKDIETLRYVLPYLDQKALVQPACKTVIELAHSKTLREPNREEFHRALDRVMTLCADKGLIERAKKYKAGG